MRRAVVILVLVVALFPCLVYSQMWEEDPFAWMDELNRKSLSGLYSELKKWEGRKDPYSLWAIAEIKRRLGDPHVEKDYMAAINSKPEEPAFELFLADYYRNDRGPKKPLFPEAEKHYFEALRKLDELEKSPQWKKTDEATKKRYSQIRRRVDRALIDLYQEDGVPIVHRSLSHVASKYEPPPIVSFATINQYGLATTDPDRVDDARSFTSEALFAQSAARLNRPLTRDELDKIARTKELFENFDRFRFRYEDLPVVDFFYQYRHIDDAQITNFFLPTQFNNVHLNEFGVAIEKPFNGYPYFDAFLRGAYSRVAREGIIEFFSDKVENINQFLAEGAVSTNFLGFLGPDKAILNVKYAHQDINPDIPNPPQRDRDIFSSTLTYQLSRPLRGIGSFYGSPFASKGAEFFAGYAHDIENFGGVDVRKNDFFVGGTVKGIGPVDLTLQPTYFTGDVEGDTSQNTAMYRTNFIFLYRIWDEDKFAEFPPGPEFFAGKYNFFGLYPAFLHFAIPIRHDIALDGPSYFENFRIGTELSIKLVTVGIGRTTFLSSVRYDFQRFYNIDRDVHLVSLNLSMGF